MSRMWDYAKHIHGVLAREPKMSLTALCEQLNVSRAYLHDVLSLVNVHPTIGKLINEEEITVAKGAMLARLQPPEEQLHFLILAMKPDGDQMLRTLISLRVKELRHAKRALREPNRAPEYLEARAQRLEARRQRTCTRCGTLTDDAMLYLYDGLCVGCQERRLGTPAQRGKVLCLQAGCHTWIKDPMARLARGLLLQVTYYYCKAHQLVAGEVRSISEMPRTDRQGDAIWVTGQHEVKKIKHLDDDHLTNIICLLEKNAKKRCHITGVDESLWQQKLDDRYDTLVAEAKRRDAHLRCLCKDGIVATKTYEQPDGTVLVQADICKDCPKGRERQAAYDFAEKVAKENAGKRKGLVIALVVTLVAAGAAGTHAGQHFIAMVVAYLKDLMP